MNHHDPRPSGVYLHASRVVTHYQRATGRAPARPRARRPTDRFRRRETATARDGDGGAGDGDGGAETFGERVDRVVVDRVVEGAEVDDGGTLDAREGRWDDDEDRRRRREEDEEDATRGEASRRVVLDDEEEDDDDDASSDI